MTADRISRNLTGLLLVGGLAAIATAWGSIHVPTTA